MRKPPLNPGKSTQAAPPAAISGPTRDPIFVSSFGISLGLHVLIIVALILIPWLLGLIGSGAPAPYLRPGGGGGGPQAEVVKVKSVKQQKKRKTYTVRMNSAISFVVPKIDESPIAIDLAQTTENTYQAGGQGSGVGRGGKGRGGWGSGDPNGVVRFIRLQYDGGDWDRDMGRNADYNMLVEFQKLTKSGFKIATDTESVAIGKLRQFPKGKAPPFVFMTGAGGISATDTEVKALRSYLTEEGGMIFATNGGGSFDISFRNGLMARVFPELSWSDIPNDDIIYRYPFVFPNGAPPLWHHSGDRAMGLKFNGRWVAFYHQGDMIDAWKAGNSGASDALIKEAYKLGVNVIVYAFNMYDEQHSK